MNPRTKWTSNQKVYKQTWRETHILSISVDVKVNARDPVCKWRTAKFTTDCVIWVRTGENLNLPMPSYGQWRFCSIRAYSFQVHIRNNYFQRLQQTAQIFLKVHVLVTEDQQNGSQAWQQIRCMYTYKIANQQLQGDWTPELNVFMGIWYGSE